MGTPKRMAEAGFYFCGGDNEPDLVRCYFCRKELDGWEPEDDPWEEHKSHTRGKCPYVNLGKRPHELSVHDVLGKLEPERAKCLINKIFEIGKLSSKERWKKRKERLMPVLQNMEIKKIENKMNIRVSSTNQMLNKLRLL